MSCKVSEAQFIIDASQEITKEKFIKVEGRFAKEQKENTENLTLIETESDNIKKKLQDLEDRSRCDNLRFDGIAERQSKHFSNSEENSKGLINEKNNIQ